jgi:hypothetical protein
MSFKFTVSEERGDKLYKLIIIRLSNHEGIKIVSKEAFNEKIHFCIYLGKLDQDTKEFITKAPRYKSTDNGLTKEEFETFISETFEKMPETAEIFVNDLSSYSTLKEQFKEGLNKDFMKVVSTDA